MSDPEEWDTKQRITAMFERGLTEQDIMDELGLEPEELARDLLVIFRKSLPMATDDANVEDQR